MEALKKITELPAILYAEDENWQRRIYERAGVLLVFNKHGGVLVNECGYVDLYYDVEYSYSNEKNCTAEVSIKSIQELMNYICRMESYQKYLVDKPIGLFLKSELFWSVQEQIILAEDNQRRKDGSTYQDWGLYKICTDLVPVPPYKTGAKSNAIILDMALVDYDSTELWVPQKPGLTLSETLQTIVSDLNRITDDIEDVPQYAIHDEIVVTVPRSFEELLRTVQPGGIFDWLV